MHSLPRSIKVVLKLLLTAGALGYVFVRIDQEALIASLMRIDPVYFLLGLIFFNLSQVVSALRLASLFRAIGVVLGYGYNMALYYVGMFYNLFLPGGIGGDGYKVYHLHRRYATKITWLIQALLLDRLSGFSALIFLVALLIPQSPFVAFWPWIKTVSLIVAIAIFPIGYLAVRLFFRLFIPFFFSTLLLSLVVQVMQLLCVWSLLVGLGIDTNHVAYLMLFLLSSVAAIFPVTIGGVGIRELVFLYGLEAIDQPPSVGVGLSFLFFALTLFSSLIGFFFIDRLNTQRSDR